MIECASETATPGSSSSCAKSAACSLPLPTSRALCVSIQSTVAAMCSMDASRSIEPRRQSKLARVWQCRSTNARPVIGGWDPSDLLDQRLLEEVEVLQREAGAQGDAAQRVLGDVARDAGDLGQQLVHVAQEGATAGHDH